MTFEQLHTRLFDETMQRLQFTDEPQPKAIITFCGIPGSGKTAVAARLAKDLHAQYVQQDAMRQSAHNRGFENVPIHDVTHAVEDKIMADHANKLVLLDASIDRTWRDFLAQCAKLGATPIIIRIAISPAEANTRLQKRGRYDDAQLIAGTPTRQQQFEDCKKELAADVEVTVPFDYQEVLRAVQNRLSQL